MRWAVLAHKANCLAYHTALAEPALSPTHDDGLVVQTDLDTGSMYPVPYLPSFILCLCHPVKQNDRRHVR